MAGPINPDYPIVAIASVDELMAIAVAMEAGAATRYEQLARRTRDDPEMAALFRDLARLEREHEQGLVNWTDREGRPRPSPARLAWRLPETFGDEAEERPLAPYQALAIAVRNEERAFAFYAYLAALCAGRQELSARAEALAREELRHVALLRRFRRRAFHARERSPPAPAPAVETVAELHTLVERLEASADAGTLRHTQELLETCLAVAERAGDEAVLAEAQRLAQAAMARLAQIRARDSGGPPVFTAPG